MPMGVQSEADHAAVTCRFLGRVGAREKGCGSESALNPLALRNTSRLLFAVARGGETRQISRHGGGIPQL